MNYAALLAVLLALGCSAGDGMADAGVPGDAPADADSADAAMAPRPPLRIACIGDSITDGNAVKGAYRTELWRLLGGEVDFMGRKQSGPPALPDRDHEGYPGYNTKNIHGIVLPWLRGLAVPPAVVVLHVGTNDLFGADALAVLEVEWPAIVADVRRAAPGARVLAFPLTQWWTVEHQRAEAWNARLAVLAPALGVEVLDVRLSRAEAPDDTHPSAAGYARMAAAIARAIQGK